MTLLRSQIIGSAAAFGLLLGAAPAAGAFKMGGSLGYAGGTGEFDNDFDQSVDYDRTEFAGGFVLDVGPTGNFYHYRFHAGLVIGNDDFGSIGSDDRVGVTLTHTFAMNMAGANGGDGLKVWAGPTGAMISGQNSDLTFYALGLGPTLGIDFPKSKTGPAFSAELGYVYAFGRLLFDDEFIDDRSYTNGDLTLKLSLLWGD